MHKYIGTHAEFLGSGQPIAPGDTVEIDADDTHDARLLDEGLLIEVAGDNSDDDKLTGKALQDRAAELEIEGRSDLSADELRQAIAEAEDNDDNEEDDDDSA